jgi:hypothetical protein
MFCPNCRTEYSPGFTRCSDCSVDLVVALPLKPRASLPEHVHVYFLAYVLPAVFIVYLLVVFFNRQRAFSKPYIAFPWFFMMFASNCGSFWVLYQAWRYEKRPLRYALLACIPYSFFWYYLARVQRRKLL